MEGDCDVCSTALTEGVMEGEEDETMNVFQWTKVDKKVRKVSITFGVTELISELNARVTVLKKHIYVKRCQNKYYNTLKTDLKPGQLLLNVDYSENYVNQEQQEIQSAYFGHDCFSIFTACCYLRAANGDLINENITVTSEASEHSRISAHTCVMTIIEKVQDLHPEEFNSTLFIWSDGCAAQFRSRFVFYLLARMDKKYEVEWCYNERHHGKGPMDGIGGTIKNKVFRDVKSGKIHINGAKSFAEHADHCINNITSLYLPLQNVLEEPDGIESAQKIPSTLQVHRVVRNFNDDGVCKLKFYRVANDDLPFHEQFYRKPGDPEVCDHELLPLSYNQDSTCAKCKGNYIGKEFTKYFSNVLFF